MLVDFLYLWIGCELRSIHRGGLVQSQAATQASAGGTTQGHGLGGVGGTAQPSPMAAKTGAQRQLGRARPGAPPSPSWATGDATPRAPRSSIVSDPTRVYNI